MHLVDKKAQSCFGVVWLMQVGKRSLTLFQDQ